MRRYTAIIPCKANLEGCLRVIRTKASNAKYCASCAKLMNNRKCALNKIESKIPVLRAKRLPEPYRTLTK